jgi:UDP:flavonoid glycosyltransferase YjiC (YdhE family)
MKNAAALAEGIVGKRILFANFPLDGHFNPLTGLAVHLKQQGADVRWYCPAAYGKKLKTWQIPHYPFVNALELNEANNDFDQFFPERAKQHSQIAKLKFDIIHLFILRAPEYYADMVEIRKAFPFDLLIADCLFTAIPFVKIRMQVPIISIGIIPLAETSKDLPPAGIGMEPSYTFLGKIKQTLLRGITKHLIFRGPTKIMHTLFDQWNTPHNNQGVFDILISNSDLLLQIGTPGFEYPRSDMNKNIRFIGPLLPYQSNTKRTPWFDKRLNEYKHIILLTQGTVEKDIEKLLAPTLEAFKATDYLVICTTGNTKTAELRTRFPQDNIIIEDFIPFADVMPYAHVYVTNGGYGGVMLSIANKLPLVVAGIHEYKNEINAHIGYFKLGVNLKSEAPSSAQIKTAVQGVIGDPVYKKNVAALAKEFSQYDPYALSTAYVAALLQDKMQQRAYTQSA